MSSCSSSSNSSSTTFSLLCFLLLLLSATICAAQSGGSTHLRLPSSAEERESSSSLSCEETFGFLPCSNSVLGNLFLIVVYGYLIFNAATFLSNGSELLLEILGPGVVRGFFLHMLGALPDAMLIFVSGLSGSTEIAEEKVSVGMGLLAGSTVIRLTLIWGTLVVVGKCDLEDGSRSVNKTDTKGFHLLGSGVSTDIWTSYAARIMVISVLPFIVVQLPQVIHSRSERHLAILVGLGASLFMLFCYCIYQVFQPKVQKRWLDYVRHKRVMTGFLKHLRKHALGRLCNPDGTPNYDVIEKLFKAIDQDGDNHLCKREIRAFIIGMRLDGMSPDEDDIVDKVIKEFDTERQDDKIDLDEFIKGISKLLNHIKGSKAFHHHADDMKHIDAYDEEAKMEHFLLGDSSDEVEVIENPRETTIKAVYFVLIGTFMAAVFSEPLINAFQNFSNATGIPSFFISFIALPLATNSGEAVAAIKYASKKTRGSAKLIFSEIYGGVTVNNLLCLSVFLAVVYVRGLTWDFSSEVLIIFLVFVIMGALGSFRTAFPLWTAFMAFLLYPLSLVVVYILDYTFGWS